MLNLGVGQERGRPAGGDPEYPVRASAVRGGHVQGAVRAEHGGAQPAVRTVQAGRNDMAHERAARGELEDPQRLPLQRRDRQPPVPLLPVFSLQEDAAAGGQRMISRRPSGLDRTGKLHQVGHGHALVVGRHRIPTVVAARAQQVDLVVHRRAVLYRPHLVRARTARQPLWIAMAGGVDSRPERVTRRRRARRGVDAEHFPAERVPILRDCPGRGVAGCDPQIPLRTETQAAAAVLTGGGDVVNEGVIGAGGRGVGRVYRPGNHLHFRPGMGLTGVEPSVGSERGVDDDGHQSGLSRYEQVVEVGTDGLDRPVGQPTAQPASPLGEQHRPVGREGHPPRNAQAGDQRDDGQLRAGLPLADHMIRHHLGGLPGALAVGVARRGSQVLPLDAVRGRVVGLGRSVDSGPGGLVRGLGPLPGHGVEIHAVRVAQRCPHHRPRPELSRKQRHGPRLVDIGDLDGHRDGVVDLVVVGQVVRVLAITDRDDDFVLVGHLVVEGGPGQQLSR